MLLHLAGPDVQEIFTTVTETGDATNYASAVEALNPYFVPQVNSAFTRQTFYRITQNPGETVQQFVTRLRKAAKDCDFGTDTDNQIRDAVLNKCTSTYIKRKLLEEGQGLNLTRTLEVAAKCDKIETQLAALSVKGEESESINRINERSNNPSTSTQGRFQGRDKICYRCGLLGHLGQQEAKHVQKGAGKIILKKFARQGHTLVRLGGNLMTLTLGPSMTMYSVLQKENTQKWSPYE